MCGGLPWGSPALTFTPLPPAVSQPHMKYSPPLGPLSAGLAFRQRRGVGGEGVGGRACVVTENSTSHVGEEGRGHSSHLPQVQMYPTRGSRPLVLPSLGAERAHGPESGLSPQPGSGRRSGTKDWGSLRDQPGFTWAIHSIPLAAQEPSSSFKVF